MSIPRSVSSARGDSESHIAVDFDDNRLAAALYGALDAHLTRIEESLHVQASNRGNHILLTGAQPACEQAREVLLVLYEQLKQGRDIGLGEVDGALKMSFAPPSAKKPNGTPKYDIRTPRRLVQSRSPNQAAYIDALCHYELVIGTGPAGTGKTYLAVAMAAAQLESGEIEIAPLAFMRGRTLANSFIILDEAQNATPMQMKMFLTRMGEHSQMVVTGDPSQIDLPFGAKSGLQDVLEILPDVKGVSIINFTELDVVRHDMVTRIVKAYQQRDMRLDKEA